MVKLIPKLESRFSGCEHVLQRKITHFPDKTKFTVEWWAVAAKCTCLAMREQDIFRIV